MCDRCNGSAKRPCSHNNLAVKFPDLVEEWHPDNPKRPEEFLPGSSEEVLWKCRADRCGCHVWKTKICNRTSTERRGCPFCGKQRVCPHNNLAVKFPDLVEEWHPDNPLGPEKYLPKSAKRVKWICRASRCGCHVWEAKICNRTNKTRRSGCPFCGRQRICPHNNLAAKFPDLVEEWHPDNPKRPEEYLPGSSRKVWWKCKDDPYGYHVWEAKIYTRSIGRSPCPFCTGRQISAYNLLMNVSQT